MPLPRAGTPAHHQPRGFTWNARAPPPPAAFHVKRCTGRPWWQSRPRRAGQPRAHREETSHVLWGGTRRDSRMRRADRPGRVPYGARAYAPQPPPPARVPVVNSAPAGVRRQCGPHPPRDAPLGARTAKARTSAGGPGSDGRYDPARAATRTAAALSGKVTGTVPSGRLKRCPDGHPGMGGCPRHSAQQDGRSSSTADLPPHRTRAPAGRPTGCVGRSGSSRRSDRVCPGSRARRPGARHAGAHAGPHAASGDRRVDHRCGGLLTTGNFPSRRGIRLTTVRRPHTHGPPVAADAHAKAPGRW